MLVKSIAESAILSTFIKLLFAIKTFGFEWLLTTGHSKRHTKIDFQHQLSLNAGQKYCRILQGEHSAILLTFIIKLPFAIKTFVLPIFEWLLKTCFQDQLSLNAGPKYCRMLQGEHSAILLTFIKLPFAIKTFVLSIFEWLLKTGFTVLTPVGTTLIMTSMQRVYAILHTLYKDYLSQIFSLVQLMAISIEWVWKINLCYACKTLLCNPPPPPPKKKKQKKNT